MKSLCHQEKVEWLCFSTVELMGHHSSPMPCPEWQSQPRIVRDYPNDGAASSMTVAVTRNLHRFIFLEQESKENIVRFHDK